MQFKRSLALPFFGIGMNTDLFSPVATAEFSKLAGILSAALSQHRVTTTTKQTKSKMTSVAEDVHKLEHVHRWWDCIVK